MCSESSTGSWAELQLPYCPSKARGTSRKHVTKPFPQPAVPDSTLLLTELVDEAGQPDGAPLVDHLPQRLRGECGHPRDLLLVGVVLAVVGGRVLVVDVGVDVVVVVAVGKS